jgi:hypothetical protein
MGYSSLSCVWVFPTGNWGIDETSRKKKRLNEAEIADAKSQSLAVLPPGVAFALLALHLWHHGRAAAFAHTLLRHLLNFAPGYPLHQGHQRIGLGGVRVVRKPGNALCTV